MSDGITVIDLFAGAGGLSTGIATACEELGLTPGQDLELHAVNHCEPAIATHEANHPWAEHYHTKIEELHPPDIAEPDEVTLLAGGPECTHFSTARGGKPVSEQKRASAWHVLDWIEKLRPEHVLLENVPEFRKWGPIEDGTPTRDGSIFERWIGMLEALGYSVVYDDAAGSHGVTLDAADYGDPQSRTRLFILASREQRPTVPAPTHNDDDPDKPDRRTAVEIIDWSDPGESIWTRDLENPRVQPLSTNTMARIAEGIRRHCDDRLEPLADAVEQIGGDELTALREQVVPAADAATVAAAVDEPFLVAASGQPTMPATPGVLGQHSNAVARAVDERPAPTVATGGKLQVYDPTAFCLRQQSGGVPAGVDGPLPTISAKGAIGLATVDSMPLVMPRNGACRGLHSNPLYRPASRPLHTVTARNTDGYLVAPSLVEYDGTSTVSSVETPLDTITANEPGGGSFALSSPFLCPMYSSRAGRRPRIRSVDRPLMTVSATKAAPAGLATPFLVDYHGQSDVRSLGRPLGTVETKDRYALCVPEAWPWGLDIGYRMLQPRELKQAQGFTTDYHLAGDTKAEVTAQIGNAVPVNLARSLAAHLLVDETPSLSTFGCGITPHEGVEVPSYEEVLSDD
jgi:DNA (cytosine-5)-methyltransferase 1